MKSIITLFALIFAVNTQAQILTQQISNHPIFPDVERYIDVTMQTANAGAEVFEFWYQIRYIKDDTDITGTLQQPTNQKISTDQTKKILLRDSLFNPIPNPEWDGISEDEYDMYLWVTGWELIMTLINQPTNISNMIRQYILINDEEEYFDN